MGFVTGTRDRRAQSVHRADRDRSSAKAVHHNRSADRVFPYNSTAVELYGNHIITSCRGRFAPVTMDRSRSDGGDEQSGRNGVEVKALVSPVGKGGQVARAVFGEIERMVGSTCARFTAQNRVS